MSGLAAYSVTASVYHWAVAFPLMGCIGTVLAAQNAPKEKKGDLMFMHKSLGTLTGIIVAPRVAYRLFSTSGCKSMDISERTAVNGLFANLSALSPSTCRFCKED
jgi:cytochrome b561